MDNENAVPDLQMIVERQNEDEEDDEEEEDDDEEEEDDEMHNNPDVLEGGIADDADQPDETARKSTDADIVSIEYLRTRATESDRPMCTLCVIIFFHSSAFLCKSHTGLILRLQRYVRSYLQAKHTPYFTAQCYCADWPRQEHQTRQGHEPLRSRLQRASSGRNAGFDYFGFRLFSCPAS